MATAVEPIEIIQSIKTKAWYVLLEELPGDRYRVVNPNGESLTLPISHFEEEIEVVEGPDAQDRISTAQIASFNRFNQELEASVNNLMRQKEQQQQQNAPTRSSSSGSSDSAAPRKRNRSKIELPKSYYESKNARVSWQGAKLTFYRHHIDPLKGHHKFSINVVGTGIFEMTKDQFMSSFSEIILSAQYKSNGMYTYDVMPEKALRFLKKS